MQQEWKGITFDHRARERIYLYAMNEQIHELYRLENNFRAGVSVATDSIDWRIAIADSVMEAKGNATKRRGEDAASPTRRK